MQGRGKWGAEGAAAPPGGGREEKNKTKLKAATSPKHLQAPVRCRQVLLVISNIFGHVFIGKSGDLVTCFFHITWQH